MKSNQEIVKGLHALREQTNNQTQQACLDYWLRGFKTSGYDEKMLRASLREATRTNNHYLSTGKDPQKDQVRRESLKAIAKVEQFLRA